LSTERGAQTLWPVHRERVRPEWVDYNGHMNVAFYVLVFDHATDAVCDWLDLGEDYRRDAGCSVFVGEMHVKYLQEVVEGDELVVATHVLESDDKRLVLHHEMSCPRLSGPIASNEVLCVHVDLSTRRSTRWPAAAAGKIACVQAPHAIEPPPQRLTRTINLSKRHV
jgi:acyl-CoA thioester hydrolase